jgi:hypothetical protein
MPGVLRSRRGLLGIGAVALGALLLAGFAAWYFVFRDVATPTTVGEAVTNFRGDTDQTPGPSPVPVGVYVYATSGFERTDALAGATHRYPRRSTITVTKDPCGVRMRWDVLEGRSTTWTFCIDSGRWVMTTQDERHTFFGVTEGTTYECSDVPFRMPGDRPSRGMQVTCTTSGATERETQRIVGRETVRVGRRSVSAVHVHQATSLSGDIRGASTYDVWLDRKTGVPVRISMVSRSTNDSPVGDVHYDEVVTLRLLSLTPRR